ncbi:MAG: hypothetical protein QY318_02365 [Candidatus Dojkabacteria bacterium]|nr:MAG: hypothetical protein QY318_02365 [Candidatus Dojkabacteria bacterium]
MSEFDKSSYENSLRFAYGVGDLVQDSIGWVYRVDCCFTDSGEYVLTRLDPDSNNDLRYADYLPIDAQEGRLYSIVEDKMVVEDKWRFVLLARYEGTVHYN